MQVNGISKVEFPMTVKNLFQLKCIIHLFITFTLKPFVSLTQHVSTWYSLITC
jgi:hypothetical protein